MSTGNHNGRDDALPGSGYAPMDSQAGSAGRVTRYDVVREARSWLDTPYIHQHRSKGHGVDCVGLVIGVARALGLVEPDFDVTGYEPTPDGKTLLSECDRFMDRISFHLMKPGHVLVLRFDVDPQHMGIVGDYMHGGLTLIHAYARSNGKGRVEERRLDSRGRVMVPVQAYAIRGIE